MGSNGNRIIKKLNKENTILKCGSVIVEVEFGSPLKNCLHFGICRVTIPATLPENHCPCRSPARISAYEKIQTQFIFDKTKMPANTIEKYFKKGIFRIDNAYLLPAEVAEKIGRNNYVFKPGLYPVMEFENTFRIIF